MAARPYGPDEIVTPDGIRVQVRPGAEPRPARLAPVPAALLVLAAAPVVVPVAAAAAACVVGLAAAAVSAGVARRLLGPLAPQPGPYTVTVEVRWDR